MDYFLTQYTLVEYFLTQYTLVEYFLTPYTILPIGEVVSGRVCVLQPAQKDCFLVFFILPAKLSQVQENMMQSNLDETPINSWSARFHVNWLRISSSARDCIRDLYLENLGGFQLNCSPCAHIAISQIRGTRHLQKHYKGSVTECCSAVQCSAAQCTTPHCSGILKGIVHNFIMSILKEHAVYGRHNVDIISFLTWKHKDKWNNYEN